jgi:hypothetical protein
VEQEDDWRTWVAGGTVEDIDSVRFDLIDRCHRYGELGKNRTHKNSFSLGLVVA